MSSKETSENVSAQELYSEAYILYEAKKYDEVLPMFELLKTKYPESKYTRWAIKNFKKCNLEYESKISNEDDYPIYLVHLNWVGPLIIILFRVVAGEIIKPKIFSGASTLQSLAVVTDYAIKEKIILTICVFSFIPLIIVLFKNWSNYKTHRAKTILLTGSIITVGLAFLFLYGLITYDR